MATVDLSRMWLCGDNEIDNAIYAVLNAAFSEQDDAPIRRSVRMRLPPSPTAQQILDAVCDELRWRGRLQYEEQRRAQAVNVLSAFLDLPGSERADVSLMAAG